MRRTFLQVHKIKKIVTSFSDKELLFRLKFGCVRLFSHGGRFGLKLVGFGSVLEEIGVLLVRTGDEHVGCPEVGGEVGVSLGDAVEGGLDEVTKSTGGTGGASVDILDTSELEELLGGAGGNDTSTTGGGDETEANGTALTGDLVV